jgi:hypothetical protein
MIKNLYEGFKCHVVHEGKLTNSFDGTIAVRKGCRLSPTLFVLVLDTVMNKAIKGRKRGVQWIMTEGLKDFDFADDVCLHTQIWSDIKAKLVKLENEAAKV